MERKFSLLNGSAGLLYFRRFEYHLYIWQKVFKLIQATSEIQLPESLKTIIMYIQIKKTFFDELKDYYFCADDRLWLENLDALPWGK